MTYIPIASPTNILPSLHQWLSTINKILALFSHILLMTCIPTASPAKILTSLHQWLFTINKVLAIFSHILLKTSYELRCRVV